MKTKIEIKMEIIKMIKETMFKKQFNLKDWIKRMNKNKSN